MRSTNGDWNHSVKAFIIIEQTPARFPNDTHWRMCANVKPDLKWQQQNKNNPGEKSVSEFVLVSYRPARPRSSQDLEVCGSVQLLHQKESTVFYKKATRHNSSTDFSLYSAKRCPVSFGFSFGSASAGFLIRLLMCVVQQVVPFWTSSMCYVFPRQVVLHTRAARSPTAALKFCSETLLVYLHLLLHTGRIHFPRTQCAEVSPSKAKPWLHTNGTVRPSG